MTNKSKNRAICILGMHRSGTSVIARAINLLGVHLGEPEQMMPADRSSNPSGFWEHQGVSIIQERILYTLSSSWNDIWPLPEGWLEYPVIQPLKKELIDIVYREFADKPLWGWKDPRTCLILPLWTEILKQLNVDANYVIVIRNPLDVATSLWKRDEFSLNKSLLLWQLYTLTAITGTKDCKRVLIQYDKFLEDWKPSLKRISTTLRIPWPTDERPLSKEIEDFLDPTLRHSQSSIDNIPCDKEISDTITATYRLCLVAAECVDFLNSNEFSEKIDKLYVEHATNTRIISSVLKETLQHKNDLILRMNIQIQEKEEIISSIHNTWSWKITAPLRWLGRLILKIRNDERWSK